MPTTSTAQTLIDDQRLIEAGFPCHQVGAETRRERDTGKAPPTHRLHIWWARRPLVPSRAAILASLMPADADPEQFVQDLGIVRWQAKLGEERWTLVGDTITKRFYQEDDGRWVLPVDKTVLKAVEKEQQRREACREMIGQLEQASPEFQEDSVVQAWKVDVQELPTMGVYVGAKLEVVQATADPAGVKEKIEFAKRADVKNILGTAIRWDPEDSYGYSRAFAIPIEPLPEHQRKVVLDPTSGGGSIPFEALRLGHKVIANELNPVASVILKATLDYPARFGESLLDDILEWVEKLQETVEGKMAAFTPFSPIPADQRVKLEAHLHKHPELVEEYSNEHDHMGLLYCRQVTCPHCVGDAPLLNSLWLSKEGEKWGVAIKPQSDRTVRFEPFEVTAGNSGPSGEDLDAGTVSRGVGQCVHCQQAISGDEIKRQARGESDHGKWKDVLYSVVSIRLEPKLDRHGRVQRFVSGERNGQIKTKKVRYFRSPNEADLEALQAAELELEERRLDFEVKGLIPNSPITQLSNYNRGHRMYGEELWSDMFTPRQLLGHLTALEALYDVKNKIIEKFGFERGRAIVTYLQFMLDKGIDYNCRHTRWEYTRGIIKGAFSRHNFATQWTFGEMVFSGPSSGFMWGVDQVLDSYKGIAELASKRNVGGCDREFVKLLKGSATNIGEVNERSVDAIVMDPPYYDNVQYSELSDFYYAWHKRSVGDLYPGWFDDEETDKYSEAVANPARDGSARNAKARYEQLMQEIFTECKRVLKLDGIMTLMFTHKSSDAWETLTNALIHSGWHITSCMPVDSESSHSMHQMNLAAAASTIFIACRPADRGDREPSSWAYEVKGKLEAAVREGLGEFERLKLNPVDRMIASWGRALRVYSAHWPVQDGDDEVPPTRAMQEAARVVAEEEVSRLSGGLVTVDDLDAESRLAVIALGINGLGDFAFDDALQMSRSLNFRLQNRNGNYRVSDDMVAYANVGEDERAAPLAIRGNKLRLLKPEERAAARLESPQTLWDVLGGLIITHREGGIVAARNYLSEHGKRDSDALRGLLKVWAKECRDDELKREAQLIDYEL
ncbi:MAG: DNA methylase [Haliea sp.]|nr:DNA methylase [Haliea sp.]